MRTRAFVHGTSSVVIRAGVVGAMVVSIAQAAAPRVAKERETAVNFPRLTAPSSPTAPTAPTAFQRFTAASAAKG